MSTSSLSSDSGGSLSNSISSDTFTFSNDSISTSSSSSGNNTSDVSVVPMKYDKKILNNSTEDVEKLSANRSFDSRYTTPPLPSQPHVLGTGSSSVDRRQSHYDIHASVCSSLLCTLQGDKNPIADAKSGFGAPRTLLNSHFQSASPNHVISPESYNTPDINAQIQSDHRQHMYAMLNVKCAELTAREKINKKEIKTLKDSLRSIQEANMELTNLLSEKECDRKYCEMKLQDSQATIASMKESIRASAARNKQMLIEIEEAIACDRGIPVCREMKSAGLQTIPFVHEEVAAMHSQIESVSALNLTLTNEVNRLSLENEDACERLLVGEDTIANLQNELKTTREALNEAHAIMDQLYIEISELKFDLEPNDVEQTQAVEVSLRFPTTNSIGVGTDHLPITQALCGVVPIESSELDVLKRLGGDERLTTASAMSIAEPRTRLLVALYHFVYRLFLRRAEMRHAWDMWKVWSRCTSDLEKHLLGYNGKEHNTGEVADKQYSYACVKTNLPKDVRVVLDGMDCPTKPEYNTWLMGRYAYFLVLVGAIALYICVLKKGQDICGYALPLCIFSFNSHTDNSDLGGDGIAPLVLEVLGDMYNYVATSASYLESYACLQIIKLQVPNMGELDADLFHIDCAVLCMRRKVNCIFMAVVSNIKTVTAEVICDVCISLYKQRITS